MFARERRQVSVVRVPERGHLRQAPRDARALGFAVLGDERGLDRRRVGPHGAVGRPWRTRRARQARGQRDGGGTVPEPARAGRQALGGDDAGVMGTIIARAEASGLAYTGPPKANFTVDVKRMTERHGPASDASRRQPAFRQAIFFQCLRHILLALAIVAVSAREASAYTDPGSGILLWQLVTGAAVGALFYVRRLAIWIRTRFGRRSPDDRSV